ncbi:MAG: outer membrane beta-barrel protein [Chryseolinea sp.]
MQNKLAVILFMLAFGFCAKAQTSQGSVSLGGGFNFGASKDQNPGNDDKTTSFSFSPQVGYFVVDNFEVGLALSLSTVNQKPGDGTDYKDSGFGIGPFARYYIFTSNEKFAFFGDARFGFNAYKHKPESGNDSKGSVAAFSVSPGFVFFPTKHWGVELSLSLLSITSQDPNKDGDNDKRTNVNFGFNSLSTGVGVKYYITR